MILLKPHSFIYGHIFTRSRVSVQAFSYRPTYFFTRRPNLHTILHMHICILTVDYLWYFDDRNASECTWTDRRKKNSAVYDLCIKSVNHRQV